MARRLFLIRHAKSSWDHSHLDDFHRPLNKRGLHDAPRMAALVRDRFDRIGRWYSSPANRALSTALHFVTADSHRFDDLILAPELYAAEVGTLLRFLHGLPSSLESVAIFGHNPGISDLLRFLLSAETDDLPTCAVAVLSVEGTWDAMDQGKAGLEALLKPKREFPES